MLKVQSFKQLFHIFEDSETEGHNSDNKEDNKAGDDKSNNAG